MVGNPEKFGNFFIAQTGLNHGADFDLPRSQTRRLLQKFARQRGHEIIQIVAKQRDILRGRSVEFDPIHNGYDNVGNIDGNVIFDLFFLNAYMLDDLDAA